MILILAVLHAPRPAQALLFDFVPSTFFDLSANEPVMLLVTGLALLALGRLGAQRGRQAERDERAAPTPRVVRAAPAATPARQSRSARRAA
jgi:hypothetical protein